MKVLVTEELADGALHVMREGGLEVDVRTGLSAAELEKVIGGYDALLIRSATKVTPGLVAAAGSLKVIGRAGIGVDNVDLDAATRRGILVVNAPQGNIISAAELTVGLLLALARQIPQAHASLVAGQWRRSSFMGVELADKTLGLVGFGRVGKLVAQRCMAFGMRVIARDPYIPAQQFAQLGIEQVELDELLSRSDVISFHVVKTPETLGMFGAAELGRCKRGVLVVNTSRGGVIDEEALASALKSGRVAGAALDVFAAEPTTESPLFELNNVVVTPHLGASTSEAQDKAGVFVAEQVLAALRGDFVAAAVNIQARELPESVRGFAPLATKLGRLACALAKPGTSRLEVSFHGAVASEDTRLITLSALRGFLESVINEPVTFVNAPVLAKDRGLEFSEVKSPAATDYTNLVTVTAGDVSVSGTLMGPRNEERLVEVDKVGLEITITPYMAFFRYQDRPGVVHKMSGVLAANDINIATMQVGRREQGGEAVMGLSVDSPIPSDVFEETKRAAQMTSGRFVELG